MTERIFRPGLEGISAGETDIAAVEQTSLRHRGSGIGDLTGQRLNNRIIRPLSRYTGRDTRKVVPLADRA